MRSTNKKIFFMGVRDGAPFLLVVGPFAMLFGVVATEAGLNVLETLLFSVAVIAGAAQFTALQLLTENAPAVIALLSALAVNLRMAMYSATLTPYVGDAPMWQRGFLAYFLVDQTFATSMRAYPDHPEWTTGQRVAYFFGVATLCCIPWYGFTVLGALVGNAIPQGLALDFALPITFLAMIAPMLTTPAHLVACGVAVAASLCLTWVPYNFGLILSGLAGMIAGAQVEQRMEARK
ncbi:AzlC family ABC transporter permease [Pseudooceanicola aestuarii]|uniref:AzlC family ABC transporter permease n=1 Tax=Pseudooceanicola aestuarii TaxID=2697319 RepID=UPI0013D070A1|nr:AzlC family ABC transporter permease [Pseudooceanicola aestuarii]